MYNITLVGTLHSERGKCNSHELYKIIESVNPEVIFEELDPGLFEWIYSRNENPEEPQEVRTVRRYLRHHPIKHIPVDIPFDPKLTNQFQRMLGAFGRYHVYKEFEAEQIKMTESDGFPFLNSKRFMQMVEEKKKTENNLMEFMPDKLQLLGVHKSFYEEQNTRETKWLENIYAYSKSHTYERGLLLCGCAHKNSILNKIPEFEKKETLKLNWTFFE